MCKLLMAGLLYMIPFIPWCRKHREWENWNGLFGYVCPQCARTPEYKNAVNSWLKMYP